MADAEASTPPRRESEQERRLREWLESGRAITELEGAGKPLPGLGRPYEPGWWAKRWFEREQLRDEAFDLSRALTREIARIVSQSADAAEARRRLEELNEAIDRRNESLEPDDRLPLLDVERLVEMARSRRRRRGERSL